MPDTTGYHVDDFLVLPGQWRPQCQWEHIAWISPPWPGQYYLWLDLPEAVFCDQGNLFLSHINEDFPALFPDQPKVPWSVSAKGLFFKRRLPNGVEFGAGLEVEAKGIVRLNLWIENNGEMPLHKVHIQTCAYMRGIKEFSALTNENKHAYRPGQGFAPLGKTVSFDDLDGGGSAHEFPVIATCSNEAERLVAMTWFGNTARTWGNRNHPCMHADPRFPDLEPGQRAGVEGAILFYEGSLEDFARGLPERF
jgi:hypothetical protein